MAEGPIGAPPAPLPMAGGGADEPWANWRPCHGARAIGAPPEPPARPMGSRTSGTGGAQLPL
eukprot:7077718-Alexandrium_andersonii.AAC.1